MAISPKPTASMRRHDHHPADADPVHYVKGNQEKNIQQITVTEATPSITTTPIQIAWIIIFFAAARSFSAASEFSARSYAGKFFPREMKFRPKAMNRHPITMLEISLDASAPPIHASPIIKTSKNPVISNTQPETIHIFLKRPSPLCLCDYSRRLCSRSQSGKYYHTVAFFAQVNSLL
jgi:hypothetical protein